MANAYATFAAHGMYCKPIAIDSITDYDGNSLPVPSADCTQVMQAKAADQTATTLTSVLTSNGTGKHAILNGGRPAAGKTGTTEDMDNAWFVGFTPTLSAAVWLGHSEGYSTMAPQYIGGRYYATMYGSDAPAPLWKTYMDAALANTPVVGFSSASTGPQTSTPGNGGSTNASDNNGGSGGATEANASVEAPTAPSTQEPSVSQAPPVQPPAQATAPAEQLPATEQTPRRTQETSQSLAPDDDETGR